MSNREQFNALVDRIGEVEALKIASILGNLGGLVGAHPSIALAVLSKATEGELEAIKTPTELATVFFKYYQEYVLHGFEHIQALRGDKEYKMSNLGVIKEFAETTGNTWEALIADSEGDIQDEHKLRTLEAVDIAPSSTTLQ